MLKLKFDSRNYRRILFGSDIHYNHDRHFIWGPRGFKNVTEHDNFIRRQVQELHPEDLVFLLGDFALMSTPERVNNLLGMFPCETYVINGNHNSGIKQAYDEAFAKLKLPASIKEAYPLKIAPNVTHLGEGFELDIDQHRFYCRHYMALLWDHLNKGRNHLCGHSHSNLPCANPGVDTMGRVLDVGVENAVRYNGSAFFTLQQVTEILNKKTVVLWDHH